MGGRIDVRADTAIAGTAGARREWPGLRQIPARGPGATPETASAAGGRPVHPPMRNKDDRPGR